MPTKSDPKAKGKAPEKDEKLGEVKLVDVRLSFPKLFKPEASVKDGPKKFGASFLMDPKDDQGKKNIRACRAAIEAVEQEKWGKTGLKYKEGRIAFLKGDDVLNAKTDEPYAGYEGMYVVNAKNNSRPALFTRRKEEVSEDDGLFYGGCYVDAIIRFYPVDDPDKGGKGIFASLEGVRFRSDGEAFGRGGASADDFDDIDDDDDDNGMDSDEGDEEDDEEV